jgi:CubicO group peptidase (beta-lactamase class C family)
MAGCEAPRSGGLQTADETGTVWKAPLLGLRSAVELDRVAALFQENFTQFGELGAAVSVWKHGKSVVELSGGFREAKREHPWTPDTIALFWSATKGLGSACLLHALQEESITLEQRVAELWPEFGHAGKDKITLAQLLSHQAGLSALDDPPDILDYPAVIAALEKQKPLWPPGTAHGYHARTFGFLVDECVRRISGKRVAKYWREKFGEPRSRYLAGAACNRSIAHRHDLRREIGRATNSGRILSRAGEAGNAGPENVRLARRASIDCGDEHPAESRH